QKTGYEDLDVEVIFVGYESLETDATILKIRSNNSFVDSVEGRNLEVELVLDTTPFYAEKGGQVADTGIIYAENAQFNVEYVYSPVEGIIVHKGRLTGKLLVGQKVHAKVDENKRKSTMRNHTATHLLHAALRKVLGSHVRQAGSLVEPTRLRFDFTHYKALTKDEIDSIENIVNEVILKAIPTETEIKSYDEAVKEGAIALFEEKYGDFVRVVKVSDFSEELCGGTHVKNTGEIGLFKIVSETAVSAGVRRIEAITGMNALVYLRENEEIIELIKKELESSKSELLLKVKKLKEEKKNLERELAEVKRKLINPEQIASLSKAYEEVRYVSAVFEKLEPDILKELTDDISERIKGIVLLISKMDDKIILTVKVPKELSVDYHAGNIAKVVSKVLGGGGGGSPTFAQAGGKCFDKLEEALTVFEKMIRKEVQ
ncbi:MAG: alanine--tRNA ligase-related protein, partial [Fervidobacterium sp.]